MSGNGDSLLYGPDHLMKEDIILVTINYRYSAFGFLSTGDEHAPGNQGLKDIVLALEWVRDNIESFGGDKDKVTIAGHSAGSAATNYLMLSDLSDGLFHQAILQSGSSLMPCHFQPKPLAQAENLAHKLGLEFNSTEDLVEKLQAVDFQAIVNVETNVFLMQMPWALRPFEFGPVIDSASPVDRKFIESPPEEVLLSGKYKKKIPMMVGGPNLEGMFVALLLTQTGVLDLYNSNPGFLVPLSFRLEPGSASFNESIADLQNLYFGKETNGTLEQYLKLYSDQLFSYPADRVTRFYADDPDTPIYYYSFTFDGPLNYFKNFFKFPYQGESHADELFYIFQQGLEGFVADENSALVRDRMSKMWGNFVKFG